MVRYIAHIIMEHSPTPAHGSLALAHTLYSAALHQHMVPSLLATPSHTYACTLHAVTPHWSSSTLQGSTYFLEGV